MEQAVCRIYLRWAVDRMSTTVTIGEKTIAHAAGYDCVRPGGA